MFYFKFLYLYKCFIFVHSVVLLTTLIVIPYWFFHLTLKGYCKLYSLIYLCRLTKFKTKMEKMLNVKVTKIFRFPLLM